MTYYDIIQTEGRRFKSKKVYYNLNNEKYELDVEDFVKAKIKFNASLLGTLMLSMELDLKSQINNKDSEVYLDVTAFLDKENIDNKIYGPYFLKEIPTYNASDKIYNHVLYDKMIKTMIEYVPIDIKYPCTVQQYYDKLVETLGFTSSVSLINGHILMESDIYEGINYTYRTVLEDIAIANGILLYVDENDIKIVGFGNTENIAVVNDDILKNTNIDFGEHYGPINSIVLSRSAESDNVYIQDEKSIEDNGLNEIKIKDNQLMNDNNRSDFLPGLLSRLNGIEYDIFDTELVGYGGFFPLQKVKFETGSKEYFSYVFNNEIEFTNGYKEVIYSEAPDESTTDYLTADKTDKGLSQVYLIVNKQEKKINGLVSEVSETKEKIVEFEESLDGIKMSVEETNNKFDKEIITNKQASGNPIEVTDAGEYPLESILIEGKSYQGNIPGEIKTVQGKEIDGKDGKYLEQKTIGKNCFCMKKQFFVNKANVYQSFSLDSFENNKLRVKCAYVGTYTEGFIDIPGLDEDETYSINYKITENTTNFKPELKLANKGKVNSSGYLRVNVELNNSSTNSVANTYITFDEIQIVKEEFANDEYEEYKENSALINLNKENLFDKYSIQFIDGFINGTNGIFTQSNANEQKCAFIEVEPNRTYSLIGYNLNTTKTVGTFTKIPEVNDKATNYIYLSDANTTKTIISTGANDRYIVFMTSTKVYPEQNDELQIYEGYEPYHELAKVGNEKDSFLDGLLTKKIGKIILDGSEFWAWYNREINGIQYTFAYMTLPTLHAQTDENKIYVISNRFIGSSVKNLMNQSDTISSWRSANSLCIHSDKFTSAEEAKAYFKENPTEVYYVLATAEKYELKYEHLQLHKGYNYITLNDELYPNMNITYLTDSSLNAQYATHAQLKIEKDKISTEVEASTKYLGEEIESTKSQITQEAGAIRGEVNDKFKDYSTTAQTNAAINVAIENHDPEIELSVSKKIEDIQIGASNLVLDSAKERKIAVGGAQATNRISVTPGEEIAVSFDVKGASVYTGNIALMEYYQNDTTATRYSYLWITGSVKTSWNRIEKIITVPKDVYSIDFGYRSSSNVKNTFRNVQIERGNKVTSYRPSSEDYSTTQEVNGKLELKVGNNEYNKIVSMLNAAADEINLKGGSKINITTAGKLIISAGNFQLDASGNIKATGGTIGGWEIATDHLSADTIIGNNCYRTYLQPVLTNHEKDTWVYSIQKGTKDKKDFTSIATIFSNGDISTVGNIKVISPEKTNVFLSINNPSRGGDARFAMNPTGNYGIYDAAFGNWREYFSDDGLTNKWILPAYNVSLDYFFTSENVFMFRPSTNGDTHLGGSKWRWIQLWAVNSTSTSSDETEKRDMLEFIEKDNAFFDKLKPISFYRKKGDRRHFGFGAQTVEKALKEVGYTSKDFAGLCFDKKTKTIINEEGKETEEPILDENGNEELSYSLRYEEFISLNTWQIQRAKERISNLEDTVKRQQETIDNLIKRIEKLEEIEGGK